MPHPIVADRIELATHDEARLLRLERVEKSPAHGDFYAWLTVRSGGFGYEGQLFFDTVHLSAALSALDAMAELRPGEATLTGQWSEDFVRLASNEQGHVWVTGELNRFDEHHQLLRFAFRTDQTVLPPFAGELRRLLEA